MITSRIAMDGLIASVADLNQRQTDISKQISTGVRLVSLADDPAAAGQALQVASALRTDGVYLSTAATASSRMQAADTALSEVVKQLTSAVSSAVAASSDYTSSAGRTAAVQELTGIRTSLLALANTSHAGAYLFSGSGTTQPFTLNTDGSVTYSGNADTPALTSSQGVAVATSVEGSSVFLASGASVFGSLNDLISAMQSGSEVDNAQQLVGSLRGALDNVIASRVTLNTNQTRIATDTDYVTTQKTNLAAQQSSLLSADTASLATELSAVTTQRSALLSTIGIVQKGSLFDYL